MLSYPTFHKFRKKGKIERSQSKHVKIIQAFYFQKVIMHQERLCEISTLGCFITNNLFRKLIYSSFLQLHYGLVYLAVIWSCLSSPEATASKALAVSPTHPSSLLTPGQKKSHFVHTFTVPSVLPVKSRVSFASKAMVLISALPWQPENCLIFCPVSIIQKETVDPTSELITQGKIAQGRN